MQSRGFTKGHALGNDYIVLREADLDFELTPRAVSRLCRRREGVGADGIVSVSRDSRGSELEVTVWNADGTTAEVSGNGLRIAALALWDGLAGRLTLIAAGCPYPVSFERDGLVAIELPPASIGPPRAQVEVEGLSVRVTEVNVGNPHAIVEASELDDAAWTRVAAALGTAPRWPEQINVERLALAGPHALSIDIHERGVGWTAASGTGATACAAAARSLGLVGPGPLEVRMVGGTVRVDVTDAGLRLAGPVALTYEGLLPSGFPGA